VTPNRTTPTPNPSPPQVGPARLAHYKTRPGQARGARGGEQTSAGAALCVDLTRTCISPESGPSQPPLECRQAASHSCWCVATGSTLPASLLPPPRSMLRGVAFTGRAGKINWADFHHCSSFRSFSRFLSFFSILRFKSLGWRRFSASERGPERSSLISVAVRCPLTGWYGRAPAAPAIEAARGAKDKELAMSGQINAPIAAVGIDKRTWREQLGMSALVRLGLAAASARCPV
jgi:hypothetical protein